MENDQRVFHEKHTKFYKLAESPPKPGIAANNCARKGVSNRATRAQVLVQKQAEKIAKSIMTPTSDDSSTERGMMIYHGMGSGKTFTAMAILSAYTVKDTTGKFKLKNGIRAVHYITKNDTKKSGHEEFTRGAHHFFGKKKQPYTRDELMKTGIIKGVDNNNKSDEINPALMTTTFSLAQAGNRIGNKAYGPSWSSSDGIVYIIDEAHLLFENKNGLLKKHQGKLIDKLSSSEFSGCHVYLLSGTPGSKVTEVTQLLNMIKPKGEANLDPGKNDGDMSADISRVAARRVSHVNSNFDLTRFPKVTLNTYLKPVNMSVIQTLKYYSLLLSFLKKRNGTGLGTGFQCLNDKELSTLASYGNMIKNSVLQIKNPSDISQFAPKLGVIADDLNEDALKGRKQFCFSTQAARGACTIAKILTDNYGWTKLIPLKHLEAMDPTKKLGQAVDSKYVSNLQVKKEFHGMKFYALAKASDTSACPSNLRVNQMKKPTEERELSIKAFNMGIVMVLLGTDTYNVGIDLVGVRRVTIVEPFLTTTKHEQAIARAARFCSHAKESPKDWDVEVRVYKANPRTVSEVRDWAKKSTGKDTGIPGVGKVNGKTFLRFLDNMTDMETLTMTHDNSVDSYIEKKAKEDAKPLDIVLNSLRTGAVDCMSLYHHHGGNIPCLGGIPGEVKGGVKKRSKKGRDYMAPQGIKMTQKQLNAAYRQPRRKGGNRWSRKKGGKYKQ